MRTAITFVLAALLLLGACAERRKLKPVPAQYEARWSCIMDAVDAKTGKPSLLHCQDDDGNRWQVKAME